MNTYWEPFTWTTVDAIKCVWHVVQVCPINVETNSGCFSGAVMRQRYANLPTAVLSKDTVMSNVHKKSVCPLLLYRIGITTHSNRPESPISPLPPLPHIPVYHVINTLSHYSVKLKWKWNEKERQKSCFCCSCRSRRVVH